MYCVYHKEGNLSGIRSGTKWIFNDWTAYMYIETTDIILSVINNVKKYLQSDGGGRFILCRMFLFLFLTDKL